LEKHKKFRMKGFELAYLAEAPDTEPCKHILLLLAQMKKKVRITLDDPYCPAFLYCKVCGCCVAIGGDGEKEWQ